MKRILVLCLTLVPAFAVAQSKTPAADALKAVLARGAKNTVAAFEEMPADKFNFKPTPEQITFGHLAAHIVEANYYFCANVGNVPAPKVDELKGEEGKDKLVAAMKTSFDFCETAVAKADDSNMGGDITWFDGKPKPRAYAYLGLAGSLADHYGMAAIYLRLNGLVPPTAKPAPKK